MQVTSKLEFFLVFSTRDFSPKDPENFVFVNISHDMGTISITQFVWDGISARDKKQIISAAQEKVQDFLKDKDYILLPMDPTFEEPETEGSCARLYFRIVKKSPS